MDFKEVCGFLGGTIFYDDLRSDLSILRSDLSILHTKLEEQKLRIQLPSLDESGSYLLLQALVHLLSGNIDLATHYLEYIRDEEVYSRHDRRWHNRAGVYIAFVYCCRAYPPILKTCDLQSSVATRNLMETKLKSIRHSALGNLANIFQSPFENSLDMLEARTVFFYCNFFEDSLLPKARLSNSTLPPYSLYDGERLTELEETSIHQTAEIIVEQSLKLGFVPVAAYVRRLQYELARARGRDDSLQYLELMKLLYDPHKDDVGMGVYCLAQGDHRVSPCFTSPLLFNLDITDGLDDCGGDSTMFFCGDWASMSKNCSTSELRARKSSIKLQCSEAMQWYRKAEHHFLQAQSRRGRATAALRRASILQMEVMQPGSIDLFPVESKPVIEACIELAQQSGDIQTEKLAQFQFMLSYTDGYDQRDKARCLGQWSRDSGNVMLGLTLALLSLRQGRYYRYISADLRKANTSCEVGRQIANDNPSFGAITFYALLEYMENIKSTGDTNLALVQSGHLCVAWGHMSRDCMGMSMGDYIMSGAKTMAEKLSSGSSDVDILVLTLAEVVDAMVSLGLHRLHSIPFPDAMTTSAFSILERQIEMKDWVLDQRLRIEYTVAMREYNQHLRDGNPILARLALSAFLDRETAIENTSLMSRLYHVDVAHLLGKEHLARSLLSRISDDDLVSFRPRGLGHCQSRAANARAFARQHRKLRSLEEILKRCINLRIWSRANKVLPVIEAISPGYFSSVSSYTRIPPWKRCLYAGLVYEGQNRHEEAVAYFLQGVILLQIWSLQMSADEYRFLLAEADVSRLMGAAARQPVLCKTQGRAGRQSQLPFAIDETVFRVFENLRSPCLCSDADSLMFTEASRPLVLWYDELTDGATKESRKALYAFRVWRELLSRHKLTHDERITLEKLRLNRESFISQSMRSTPLLIEHHLRGFRSLDLGGVFDCIADNAVIINMYITVDGLLLMAVGKSGVEEARFNGIATQGEVRDMVIDYVNMIKEGEDIESARFESLCNSLSDILINPIETSIATRDHVIFIVSGVLTRLPLGTLRYKGSYIGLQRQISQVPSLRALKTLVKRVPPKLKVVARSVIARPGKPGNQWLPMAGIEALLIAETFGTTATNAEDTSREDFLSALQGSDIIHVCTHGLQDVDYPFESHVVLKDNFKVLDMLAVNMKPSMVIFSACLSGVGRASDSGDTQGFSHAILEAGANLYLGALWKVNDIATMLHMHIFYANLLYALDTPSIVEAWKEATCEIYFLTTETAIAYLEKIGEAWDKWVKLGKDPAAFVGKTGKKKLQRIIQKWKQGEDTINFRHPKIWAAFAMVGNGSLKMSSSKYKTSTRLAEGLVRLDEVLAGLLEERNYLLKRQTTTPEKSDREEELRWLLSFRDTCGYVEEESKTAIRSVGLSVLADKVNSLKRSELLRSAPGGLGVALSAMYPST